MLPNLKVKNVEILPNLKIHVRNTTYHIHHWMLFGIAAATTFILAEGLLTYLFVKGVFIGATIQGLRYKDRFQFRNRRT